ncbi:MAG: creatininase family protein [Gaiellaceae bacterium]
MRIEDCNWMQVEEYLDRDDRLVVPLGSIEQHGYLSLGVDRILSQRVSEEAAEPLGVLVLPSLPYGLTPYFAAYPGSPTVRVETYRALLRDLLDSFADQGFRRFLFVNGHGGNDGGREGVDAWQAEHPDCRVRWHNWWAGPRVRAVVEGIDSDASHASWFENFPWTRLAGVEQPREKKPMADVSRLRELDPADVRELLGDGSLGGLYERPDEDVLRVWDAGVGEVRDVIADGWDA